MSARIRALLIACMFIFIAIAYIVIVSIPAYQTSIQTPIKISESEIEAMIADSSISNFSQRYILEGRQLLDTGWTWEIEYNGKKDTGFYFGILRLDTKNLLLSLTHPIDTDTLIYEIRLSKWEDDEDINKIIDDMSRRANIADYFLPVLPIRAFEYDAESYTVLADLVVIMAAIGFALYYFYQFASSQS